MSGARPADFLQQKKDGIAVLFLLNHRLGNRSEARPNRSQQTQYQKKQGGAKDVGHGENQQTVAQAVCFVLYSTVADQKEPAGGERGYSGAGGANKMAL